MPALPFRLPRRRRPTPAHPAHANALVAAAAITPGQIGVAKAGAGGWQDQAWSHYDSCGELRYGATWLGSALSRARLIVARPDPDDPDAPPRPVEGGGASADLLAAFCGGHTGQAEVLRLLAIHLTVAGDAYIVGWDDPGSGDQRWAVRAPDEIREQAGTVYIRLDGRDVAMPDGHMLLRVWRPHPRYSWQADSPVRGLLGDLHLIERLRQKMVAEINSRLAGAGVLMLPQELEFPTPPPPAPGPDGEEPPPRTTAQQFSDLLQEAMIAPISDRSDPSSVVPIVVTAPGEQIGNAKLLTFWSESNDKDTERLDRAIRRLALGMDVPAEVMLGVGDMNHWSAWALEESAIKLHVEPLLGLICDALTEGFLRPAVDDDPTVVIWYDTSALRQRPNRGPEAIELFDRHEISGETLRREHGFGDDDAPDDEETRRRLLLALVEHAGSDTDVVQRALAALHLLPAAATSREAAPGAVSPPSRPAGGTPAPPAGRTAPGTADRTEIPAAPTGPGAAPAGQRPRPTNEGTHP